MVEVLGIKEYMKKKHYKEVCKCVVCGCLFDRLPGPTSNDPKPCPNCKGIRFTWEKVYKAEMIKYE